MLLQPECISSSMVITLCWMLFRMIWWALSASTDTCMGLKLAGYSIEECVWMTRACPVELASGSGVPPSGTLTFACTTGAYYCVDCEHGDMRHSAAAKAVPSSMAFGSDPGPWLVVSPRRHWYPALAPGTLLAYVRSSRPGVHDESSLLMTAGSLGKARDPLTLQTPEFEYIYISSYI